METVVPRPPGPAEELTDLITSGEQVPVGVESDLDRRMAKALHDRPRVCPLLDQHGGTGVAQVVESKTIQSEGVDRRFEDSPVDVTLNESTMATCHDRRYG